MNQEDISARLAALEVRMDEMKEDLRGIEANLKALTEKPGKRWEDIVDKALWLLVAAVLAMLLARVGL